MTSDTLSRRSLLKLLGLSAAVSTLPISSSAQAGNGTAKRLIVVTTEHGTFPPNWRMSDLSPYSGDDVLKKQWEVDLNDLASANDMSPILRPFWELREHCLFVDGIAMMAAECGAGPNNHTNGRDACLTGLTIPEGVDPYAYEQGGVSFEQRIGALSPTAIASLNLANSGYNKGGETTRLGTSRGNGNTIVERKSDLKEVWEYLFGDIPESVESSQGEPSVADQIRQGREKNLHFLAGRYEEARGQVSGTDRNKLEVHQGLIQRLQQSVSGLEGIDVNKIPDNPFPGAQKDTLTGFRARTQLQAKMIRSAFELDLTRVVSLSFGGGEDSASNAEKHGLSEYATRCEWTPGEDVHSTLAHASEPSSGNVEIQRRFSEYCTFNAELVAELAHELNRAGLLGDTVILWTSSIGTGWHEMGDIPYVIIGGGNAGLNTGRYLNLARDVVHPVKDELTGPSHNQLLVSLCHAVGFTEMNAVGHETITGYKKKKNTDTGESVMTKVRTVDVTGPLPDLFS